jgi:lipid-A-disaccharide synthase
MKIFLSTAEASGDLQASALVRALRERIADVEVVGLGGERLEAAGLRPVVPQSELAIGGLVEILSSAPRILKAYAALRRALRASRPDVCVLVDSPDLNLPLAAVARRLGVPVLYYIAPQVWAWRTGRVRKLRRRVDHIAVILPFEEQLLRAQGLPATFVGHPLVDRMAEFRRSFRPAQEAAELSLDLERPVLGLLPGSRRNEIAGNLSTLLEAAALLHESVPELQVQLLLAPTLADARPTVPDFVRVVRGRTHAAMALSTCILAAPGTVTMEAALLGVPTVVVHRLNPLSFELGRRIIRVPSTCMVNLVAERGVVPERIQGYARPAALAALAGRLIADPVARAEMRQELAAAVERLGPPGAAARTAELVIKTAAGA